MIRRVTVGVDPGHLSACGIIRPSTGLQSKFSLTQVAALALSGEDCSDREIFSDINVARPDLVALRDRIQIVTRRTASFLMSDVVIECADGSTIGGEADTSRPQPDLERQWDRLIGKFRALAEPHLGTDRTGQVIEIIRDLDRQIDIKTLMSLVR